jgi:hypothetical protein
MPVQSQDYLTKSANTEANIRSAPEVNKKPKLNNNNSTESIDTSTETNLTKSSNLTKSPNLIKNVNKNVYSICGFTIPLPKETFYLILIILFIAIAIWYSSRPSQKIQKKINKKDLDEKQ